MSKRAAKLAPIGIVAGIMGYLCWPYWDDPGHPPQSRGAKLVELSAALLSPPEAPDLVRDLFTGGPDQTDIKAPTTVRTAAGGTRKRLSKQRPQAVIEAPPGLVLSGTFIRGDCRVAVIDEVLYVAGDQIPPEKAGSANCRVVSVEVDRVVLELDGKSAELVYPDPLAALPSLEQSSADGRNSTSPTAGHPGGQAKEHGPLPPPSKPGESTAAASEGPPAAPAGDKSPATRPK